MRSHDWKPRDLPNGIYCSPACGGVSGYCKRADYDKAVADSDALAKRLGEGWTPQVWENLGWHWEVCKGPVAQNGSGSYLDFGGMTVRYSFGKYTAEFRSVVCGATVTQLFADADEPEEAIGLVRQDARTFISHVEADLAASI